MITFLAQPIKESINQCLLIRIRSLRGRLGLEERRPEYPVGRDLGDCDAAHEILKTNIYHIYINGIYLNIYQVYDILEK